MVLAMPRALFPEIADERFGGGGAVGWLYSAIAIGSVIGGLTSGWIGRVQPAGRRAGRSPSSAGASRSPRPAWPISSG